nr:MAG TPA: hypothetical protein [Caudoviricetes sp.]
MKRVMRLPLRKYYGSSLFYLFKIAILLEH